MKALKTKVILSAFVLLFALVATIGSTFAWFTVATTVEVSSMELNIQSQDSLLIRMANRDGSIAEVEGLDDDLFEATQYKTTLTLADIQAYYSFATWRLEPVTAVQANYNEVSGKILSVLDRSVPANNNLRPLTAITDPDDINSATGKVIELNFYLLSQEATLTRDIVLQDLTITSSAAGVAGTDVVDAVRLAVYRSGRVTDLNTQSLIAETTEPEHIFGLTKDYGFVFTNDNPAYYFSGAEVYDAGNGNALLGFNSISQLTAGYDGVSSAPTPNAWNSVFYQVGGPADASTATKGDADTVFSLAPMTPTFVTVRIFVEGWAAKTTNNIIASDFNISFKFSIKAVA